MRKTRLHAAVSTLLLVSFVAAFSAVRRTARFDEITVGKINIVDSEDRTRVILAGGYPPCREDLAGLIFINQEGVEAGGLVCTGTRDTADGVEAGAILTFDQFDNDQIVALSYGQSGDQKRHGLTIQDRPDTLSDRVKEAYRTVDGASSPEERDSPVRFHLSRIPQQEFVSRRLVVGRSWNRASLVTLSDPNGKPRSRLEVDSLGAASISFLDEEGEVVRTIEP